MKTPLFILVFLALARIGHADVAESVDPIMTTSVLQGIGAVSRASHRVPETLNGNQVYLCITAGGGYTDVRVFAPPAVEPDRLARDLAAATKGTALSGRPVTWEAAGYSGAEVSEDHGRLWSKRATNTVAIDALEAGLAARGYTPHLVLRTPAPVQVLGTAVHPVAKVRGVRYFDRAALGAETTPVVLRTTVTPIALFVLGLLAAMPMVLSVAFLILAYRASIKADIADTVRARNILEYQSRAFATPFVVQIPLTLFAVTTGVLSSVTDVWFGTPLLRPMPPFFIGGFVPMVVILMTARIQGRVDDDATLTADDRVIRRRVSIAQGLIRFVSSLLIVCAPLVDVAGNPLDHWISPIGQIAILLLTAGSLQIYAASLKKYIDCRPDNVLTARVRRVGELCGVRVRTVFRDSNRRHKALSFCIVRRNGNVVMTDQLAASINDDELEFVLTRALVARKVTSARRGRTQSKLTWGPLLLPVGALLGVQMSGLFAPPIVMLLAVGYFVILVKEVAWGIDADEPAQRLKALEIDRKTLEQTRSLDAAIGAIRKVTMIEDVFPPSETRPASRARAAKKTPGPLREERIRNLQEAASEIGLL